MLHEKEDAAWRLEMKNRILSILLIVCMITLTFAPHDYAAAATSKTNEVNRYSVLVLDASGSMSGTPSTTMKQAAIKFCESVLNADGNNYVAIVSYASSSSIKSEFTTNLTTLKNAINSISITGNTNVTAGLTSAETLLEKVTETNNVTKNIVLLSDGIPCAGPTQTSGHYTRTDSYYYNYANASYTKAQALMKKGYYIYSLGFFHRLSGSDLKFGRMFLSDLQNAGYYDVVNASDLDFVFGEIASHILRKTGTFGYSKTARSTYFYDDNYFTKSAYNYNQSLATMTLCFAMSAFGCKFDGTYTNQSKNASDLLQELEFEDFAENSWYSVKPIRDSIGVLAANKQIKEGNKGYTLIAVAVRGSGYESEWASNFTIGASGQHQGFNAAKENVLRFLDQYVKDYDITGDIKVWLTGYSRAAATANLVAGALDSGRTLGGCTLAGKDLYAYCFETPAGSTVSDSNTNSKYFNIFNIINDNDPVPKVAPAVLGFCRYGRDIHLATAATSSNYADQKAKMLKKYFALPGIDSYKVDLFQMKKISIDFEYNFPLGVSVKPVIVNDYKNNYTQNVFLNEFVTKLTKEQLKSRSNYVDKFQYDIREACGVYFGTESSQWKAFQDDFVDRLKSNIGWLIASTTKVGSAILGSPIDLVQDYAVESLHAVGITDYTRDDIYGLAKIVGGLVIGFAVSHPNLTATLVLNISGIGEAHYPELCLAWMQSLDPNYEPGAAASFHNSAYRIIRINCPVDINVYDKSGKLVASIVDGEPQEITDSTIICSINEDGEKEIILPPDMTYQVQIIATGDGTVSSSMSEYSLTAGDITRISNYYDLPIVTGDTYTYEVPELSMDELEAGLLNGSSSSYAMYDKDNNLIAPSIELSGTDAGEAYYMVDAVSDNEAYGYVTGGGMRAVGGYALLNACCLEDAEFEGWYIDDVKVSEEAEYRFRVEKDVTVVAKFGGVKPPVASIASGIYDTPFDLTLTAQDGQSIYYTTDGSNPTTESTLYKAPIFIDKNMDIKAIAVDENGKASDITSLSYQIRCDVAFHIISQWQDGFQGELVLTNLTGEMIKNWGLLFTANFDIKNIWNAKNISSQNVYIDKDQIKTFAMDVNDAVEVPIESVTGQAIKYYVTNDTWNQDLKPGESVTIGFVAAYKDEIKVPYDFSLCGTEKTVEDLEYSTEVVTICAWGDQVNGEIRVVNQSNHAITDWVLEFDYAGEITQFWTADILSHEGNHYVVQPKDFNLNVAAAATLSLGFSATQSEQSLSMENVSLHMTELPNE